MDKINICYIGDKCTDTLELSLLSIKDIAKQIIFVWGGEDTNVLKILKEFSDKYQIKIIIINSQWDNNDKAMNGKARNMYLNYLIRSCYSWWNLTIDPDEVLDNQDNLIKFIQTNKKQMYSPKMKHINYSLNREDATVENHYCPNRLFFVDYRLFYPEVEHSVLGSFNPNSQKEFVYTDDIMIWHFGMARNMFDLRNKFINNLKKSNIHTKEFLKWWYEGHLLETYPTKQFDINKLPDLIKNYFFDNTDILEREYFKDRCNMELKHVIFAFDFYNYFKPKTAYDIGCGTGQLTFLFNRLGIDCLGIDKSEFIINKNKIYGNYYQVGDINNLDLPKRDLVMCIDILEHLDYTELDKVLSDLKKLGNNFLFSVPIKGTPEADGDRTHKIKEERRWWINKLQEKGYKIEETPENWIARNQMIIAK